MKENCRYKVSREQSNAYGNWICPFCNNVFRTRRLLNEHKKLCDLNKNKTVQKYIIDENGKRKLAPGCNAWNKGLTKETDERVKHHGETLSEGYKSGRLVNVNTGTHHSDEQKKKISEGRKKYLSEHPDKVPYLINHHSKGDSYPEKYFKEVFDNEHIEYKQNYYQCGYFLDFAWPEKKIYLEVDGEQHYVDKRIVEHDKVRTQKLLENGWTCIERVRWSEFKHLSKEKKSEYLKLVFEKLELGRGSESRQPH